MYYRYHCSGSDMSADLKKIMHRVRTNRPELFKQTEQRVSTMDGDGKVTETVRKDARAIPMSGARRHALSLSKKWF